MNRPITFVILALAAGCSSTIDGIPTDGVASDPLKQLETETGHSWSVRWRDDHTPAFLEGRTAPLAATADDAARSGRDFLKRHGALFAMRDGEDLDAQDAETDELGMTHARFTQKVNGHPVWGGDLIAHFDTGGSLVRVNGRYVPVTSMVPTLPARSSDEARVRAATAAHTFLPAAAPDAFTTGAPRLYVYPVDDATAKLAWRVQLDVEDETLSTVLEAFIDASDGSVLAISDLTETLEGSGAGVFGDTQPLSIAPNGASFILEDATRGKPATRTYSAGGRTRLPGTAVRSKDPSHWDEDGDRPGAAVDAHAYVAATWDYFAKVHGRAGWDGKGKGVHATVHFGRYYNNAFFDGKQLVFGDGDGTNFAPLAGSRDVVAHEFTHGVTFHTAQLTYQGQSGALNEAISDIFACFVDGNWQVGETIFHPSGRPRALRDIAHPHTSDNPETMDEYVQGPDDNGGVHINSTIVSHAAYLMTQGRHRLPLRTVEKIWFRALVRYLHASADFRDAADATMAAARDLGAGAEATVKEAWQTVGVIP